jgi:hypothetical protein
MTIINRKWYFCVKINAKLRFWSLIDRFLISKKNDTYALFGTRSIYFSMPFM